MVRFKYVIVSTLHKSNNNNNNKALDIETRDKWYTHMPKPVYEERDVTVLWNQAVHTDREVTANRPDIIIKNKKRENMRTDRCGNTRRQKCRTKGSGK
jgi:hypothetical protein